MSTETLPEPPLGLPPADDPFFYGWRYVERTGPNGTSTTVRVPLTEWDVLHPQEGDHIVQTDAHMIDCCYLFGVFRDIVHGRTDVKVFCDMRVDWEEGEESVFSPDITVFENLGIPWPPMRGTFPVKTMGVNPIVVVEVISPSTARVDRRTKVDEYYRMGVPLYIIVDRKDTTDWAVPRVYGYRSTPEGYVPVSEDPRGVWIEFLRLWIRPAGEQVACFDDRGARMPDRAEWTQEFNALQARVLAAEKERAEERRRSEQEKQRAEQEKQRAEQEKQRAEQEKQRAEQEKQRAEQEKQRAEAAERRASEEKQRAEEATQRLAGLEAELRRLRGEAG